MGYLEKIYDRIPIFAQNIMCSAKGFYKARERYGKKYWEYRKYYKDVDTLSFEEQKNIQIKRLKEFLSYTVSNSKFYSELYKDISIDDIKSVEDLKKLPIVDKEILRCNMETVMTVPKRGAIIGHTGGTTGKSLVIRVTKDDIKDRMAMLDNFKSRVGFENLKMRRATFNGKHIVPPRQKKKVFWRYNAACKQMIYSSFHLTEENLGYYIQSLNKFKPMSLDGFFTSMCDLASYIERKKIKIEFHPIAIFPTSETVTQTGRELLERVFGCEVYNQYASSECAPFVTECPCHCLHMELTSGVFEHFSDDDEVLVTSFTSHGTPLIRYRIGDSMSFPSQKKCSCGLAGPIVDEIEGRRLDFLYTPEGAKINAGNVSNLLKNIPNAIIRAQFIQDRMDEVTVLLETEKGLFTDKHEKIIRDEFIHKFGGNMKVNIRIVDEIPREASGKFRMIKNFVNP